MVPIYQNYQAALVFYINIVVFKLLSIFLWFRNISFSGEPSICTFEYHSLYIPYKSVAADGTKTRLHVVS